MGESAGYGISLHAACRKKKEMMMKAREEMLVLTMAGTLWPVVAFAEEAAKPAGYGGSDYLWFTIIGVILVYGVYDSFIKTP
jgi:hypothetical protein